MKRILFPIISLALFFGSIGLTYAQETAVKISPFRFELDVNPGETKVDTIKLYNETDQPKTFEVVIEDFKAGDEFGQPSFSDPVNDPTVSIASWITFSTTAIQIPKQSMREIEFTLQVPTNAEPGGHYGAIFFAPPLQPNGQVAIQGRIGALMMINVAGDVVKDSKLDTFGVYHPQVSFANNEHTDPLWFFSNINIPFAVRIQNSGTVHERPSGKIEIFDGNGKQLKNIGINQIVNADGVLVNQERVDYLPVNPEKGLVLPGTYRTFRNITWDGFVYEYFNKETGKVELVKDRPWNVMGKFTAKLTLTLGDQTTVEEVTFWIIPWQLFLQWILIIAVIVALIIGGLRMYKKQIEKKYSSHTTT